MTETDVERVARALVDVGNRWIAPNFPPSHKFRGFDELDEREKRLHEEYARAVIAVLSADPEGMVASLDDAFRSGWEAHETGYDGVDNGRENALKAFRINPSLFLSSSSQAQETR